jgi:ethanolamine-phosphate cytidylyltransferase
MKKRYFIDGCFDGYHYGHVYALYQSKQLCDELIAGTHSDEEITFHKNTPLFSYEERVFMLNYCKYIDKVVENVPYITTVKTLDDNNCSIFVHGYENVITKHNIDALHEIKESKRYETYYITRGISTTNLLFRLYSWFYNKEYTTNLDYIYLLDIYNKVKNNNVINPNEKVLLILDTWDLFHSYHIHYLLSIKSKYPDYKIICCVDEYDLNCIYNHMERAIVLCSISIIDKVILSSELDEYIHFENIIRIDGFKDKNLYLDKKRLIKNILNKMPLLQSKLQKEIDKQSKYMLLNENYLKNDVYFKILKNQFESICDYLNNMTFNENDIIVFDIDEVCLCNLMYINNFNYGYLYKDYDNYIYNYTTGIVPIINQCISLFELIHDKNIKYAFITGRRTYIKELTEINLNLEGLNKYIKLYTCPDDYKGLVKDYKIQCRKELTENYHYNIVCCIGDQISDLEGPYTGIPFLIFNPFYKTE